ncbi:hypothetical protein PtB15_14B385 [Puccinia triticina]|nr:hypothetical protein PtB15_14B385 [Puccinia triticina]
MHSGSSLPKTYLLVICILAFLVNVMGFGCPPKGKPELKDFQFGCCSKGNREFASFPGVPNFDAEFGCADRTINTAFCCKFITKQRTKSKWVENKQKGWKATKKSLKKLILPQYFMDLEYR